MGKCTGSGQKKYSGKQQNAAEHDKIATAKQTRRLIGMLHVVLPPIRSFCAIGCRADENMCKTLVLYQIFSFGARGVEYRVGVRIHFPVFRPLMAAFVTSPVVSRIFFKMLSFSVLCKKKI